MESKKHIVIFSHGFGVKKDDLGMLTDIADSLPGVDPVLFDYFSVDEDQKNLTVVPFSKQVEKLKQVFSEIRDQYPYAIIDIIGHSQGTITAPLANLDGIRKTILLNPPFDMSVERAVKKYSSREDCEVNLDGISKLYRVGGYLRIVPKDYWADRAKLPKPSDLFNEYSKKTDLVVINANQDTIIGPIDTSGLNSGVKVINLDGDHNFSGEHRLKLKEILKDIICN